MQQSVASKSLTYYRLIALWVLSEAMLGGIIHGLKIPVSGLVVGGSAVICICLMAWYVPVKGAILKATIIVAIFKMMLSPQAPPPAYIAVFFQGLLGELLFWKRRFYRTFCFVIAILALLESGLQRIVSLTIVYGYDLWRAINDFINGLLGQDAGMNYSLWIGIAYVLLHFVAGLVIGRWAAILPGRISEWSRNEENSRWLAGWEREEGIIEMPARKRRRYFTKGLFVMWVVLVLVYLQSYFGIGRALLPSGIVLKILVRSLIIVLTWYFLISPLLRHLLHRWLEKKKTKWQREISQVLELLPATLQLARESWRASAGRKGYKRLIAAGKIILVNALGEATRRQVVILTGQVQTGKTSSLIGWLEKRKDITGILTPVVDGKRIFMDAGTAEQFPMEAVEGETATLEIGKYIFSKASFDRAIGLIRESISAGTWLIIDEIGPMELHEDGFADVLREVLAQRRQNVLLVVREGLVPKVIEHFNIDNAILIHHIDELVI